MVIGSLLGLAGCAAPPPGATPDVAMPNDVYVPDASYHLLMAEIALQRKAYLVTAEEYLKAAQQSADPELARRSTEFAYDYGYDVLALAGVRRWLELEPDNQRANEYAGRMYLRSNEIDRAFGHWRTSLGAGALSDETYLGLGADLTEEQNPAGATAILVRLVNERPHSAGLRLALATVALRAGAFELALASARRAAASEPDWLQAHIVIAQALLSKGDEYAAFAYLDTLLAAGSVVPIELEYVRLLSAVGRVEEAERRLRELGKQYGIRAEFVRLHGMIAFADADLVTAQRDFAQLLANGNHVYESLYMLGRIDLIREDFEASIKSLGRVRGGGYLVRAQLGISLAYDRQGLADAALEQLRFFAETYPRSAFDVVTPRAQLLYRMGRVDEALDTFEQALRYRPDHVDLLLAYGTMLDLEGRLDEALVPMRRAVRINPMDADVLNTLGYTLANRTDRQQEAYRLIRLAVELNPDSPAIIDSMGWVLYRLGRLDEARSYLEMALAQLHDPELIAHLGEVLWETGEREAAVALWEQGLVDYPDSQPLIGTRQRFMP